MHIITTTREIEKQTGLVYAGVTRACGMDVDVFTKTGEAPLWSGAADPAPIQPKEEDQVKNPIIITLYILTDKGKDALLKYDSSINDSKYIALMKVLHAIGNNAVRQVELTKSLNTTQQKVWYIIKKLTSAGLMSSIEDQKK